MSEETNAPESEGTWSGLKKTLIGTLTTVILGGGTYLSTTLFGGHEETKTETAAPAPAPVINITNSNAQQSGGTNTIIKEKTTVVEKAAPAKEEKPAKKSETEDAPW
jgi:hypothetical protein